MQTKQKLAVLVSGTGSILDAMIQSNLPISLVIADRPCKGLEIARTAGVETKLISRASFRKGNDFDRFSFTSAVSSGLRGHGIGLVAMAGFMTILDPIIFEDYWNKILNIHPSLLPLFKGDHAVRDALAAGVTETGTTIHWATEKLDDGEILRQEKVGILPGDTVETLHERIKEVERRIYPEVVKKLLGL